MGPGTLSGADKGMGIAEIAHDLHATILHCLGLDHERLTILPNGRNERATINGGRVVREVLG